MANDNPMTPDQAQPSLSDQEIRRIGEEERLRNRFRSEFNLEEKKEPRSSWWNFLNSNFGLFLLGSVLLAGLTGFYSQLQSNARQLELRNQEVLKLTMELKYRLEQIKRYSGQMKQAAPGNKVSASYFIWYVVNGEPKYYHASLPEFSGVATYGLIGRLRLLGVTSGTDAALKSVISLENGQTQPDAGQVVYPQEFLDSEVQTLDSYANGTLVPYLDNQRHKSLIRQLFF